MIAFPYCSYKCVHVIKGIRNKVNNEKRVLKLAFLKCLKPTHTLDQTRSCLFFVCNDDCIFLGKKIRNFCCRNFMKYDRKHYDVANVCEVIKLRICACVNEV